MIDKRTLGFFKTLLAVVVGSALSASAVVWAASAEWHEVKAHTEDESKHLTPELHQRLGAIERKLDTVISRLENE